MYIYIVDVHFAVTFFFWDGFVSLATVKISFNIYHVLTKAVWPTKPFSSLKKVFGSKGGQGGFQVECGASSSAGFTVTVTMLHFILLCLHVAWAAEKSCEHKARPSFFSVEDWRTVKKGHRHFWTTRPTSASMELCKLSLRCQTGQKILVSCKDGLELRGACDQFNSNFIQLVNLWSRECKGLDVSAWLNHFEKKR